MQKGDLILSTTSAATVSWISAEVSSAIRTATGDGPVSHSAIYAGDGQILDARPISGVGLSSVDDFLSSASFAVAFRFPHISADQQQMIVDFAWAQLGSAYDYVGAVSNARFFFGDIAHVLVALGVSKNKFYCSKLVLDSYGNSGANLVTINPVWQSPNDLAALSWFGELGYVGHLKYSG